MCVLSHDQITEWPTLGKYLLTQLAIHYENLPMQYTEIFLALKIENFRLKTFDIFLIFAQNIDCGYTLEPPW